MNKTYREKYNDYLEQTEWYGDTDAEFLESIAFSLTDFTDERLKDSYDQAVLNDVVENILVKCQVYIDLRENR